MSDRALDRALREAWAGRSAHVDFDAAIAGLDPSLRATRPQGLPYSVWELVEHLRIAQEDLVAYTTGRETTSPPWPEGYWPAPRARVDDASWERAVAGARAAFDAMAAWLDDPGTDLAAELPHSDRLADGGRRTVVRQMLVALDHRAYHVGQIVAVRRALGAW